MIVAGLLTKLKVWYFSTSTITFTVQSTGQIWEHMPVLCCMITVCAYGCHTPVNLVKDIVCTSPTLFTLSLFPSQHVCATFFFLSCPHVGVWPFLLSQSFSISLKCVPYCLLCICHLFILFYMCCHARWTCFCKLLEWQKWAQIFIFVLHSLISKIKTQPKFQRIG